MRHKLTMFFDYIDKHGTEMVNCNDGKRFEDNLINCLKKQGFSYVGETEVKKDPILGNYIREIKELILDKNSEGMLKNKLLSRTGKNEYTDFFITQPFGSQNYPDFLVFTHINIFPIESKFSTQKSKKPMWNSNLPKENGLYVFGSYDNKDVTYFRGGDVLPREERKMLLSIWDKTDDIFAEWETQFKNCIAAGGIINNYGFSPYIRKAYDQKKIYNLEANIDFYNNKNRNLLEEQVKSYIEQNECINY